MLTHRVRVGDQERDLLVVDVGSVSVALLNLLGDTALTEAAAEELVKRLPHGVQTLVTPEVKAVPLAHAMSVRSGLPYVVARKTEKPYMVGTVKKSVVMLISWITRSLGSARPSCSRSSSAPRPPRARRT